MRYLEAARYTKDGLGVIRNCGRDDYERTKAKVYKLDDVVIYYSRAGQQDSAIYFFKSALDHLNIIEHKFSN